MKNRFRLVKEVSSPSGYIPSGAEGIRQNGMYCFRYIGKSLTEEDGSLRVFDPSRNPEWFEEIKEPERPDGLIINVEGGTTEEWETLVNLWHKFKPSILFGDKKYSQKEMDEKIELTKSGMISKIEYLKGQLTAFEGARKRKGLNKYLFKTATDYIYSKEQ